MAGSQRKKAEQRRKREAEKIKKWRKISNRSKLNASLQGFYGLSSGIKLCNDYSKSLQSDELEIDLAARQIEHCLESWNFLSQSAWALVNAHSNQATHMAYYAEVRAADSLFASTGIAVKKHPSYYLNDRDQRVEISGNGASTHSLIRGLWPTWCKRVDATSIFNNLKVAQSVSLQDVWDAMGVKGSGQEGLLAWGYELTNLSKDHSSRNTASYEVLQSYQGIFPAQTQNKHKFLSLVWEHLVPGGLEGQLRFEILYAQYLLWKYSSGFANTGGYDRSQEQYDSNFFRVVGNISNNTGVSADFLKELLYVGIGGSYLFEVFDLASQKSTNTENIFFRAFILARLATCRLNENIQKSACSQALDWIQSWLLELGVIKYGELPEDLAGTSDTLIEKAAAFSSGKQSDIWPEYAADAAESSRLSAVLCWGVSF